MKFLLKLFITIVFFLTSMHHAQSQKANEQPNGAKSYFGMASYYADMFIGRKTANGDIYSHGKLTAACNALPLGTYVRVTNLRNNKSVIVRINDRLHPRMTRIVDLSKTAAQQLGYVQRGLAKVKVEVIGKSKPVPDEIAEAGR